MSAMTMRAVRDGAGGFRHVPAPFIAAPAPVRGKKKRHTPDPIKTNGETAAEELRLLIERKERLEEEKRGICDDIADVDAEAKSRGYDPRALNKIIAIRKKKREEFQEEEAILETYMQALGML